jgi:hypothetical protein
MDALMRSGLTFLHLQMISEHLSGTPKEQWTGDRDTLAVINILNMNGLNPRWLEKYIETIDAIENGSVNQQSQWEGMMGGS